MKSTAQEIGCLLGAGSLLSNIIVMIQNNQENEHGGWNKIERSFLKDSETLTLTLGEESFSKPLSHTHTYKRSRAPEGRPSHELEFLHGEVPFS
ncbi:hypothetical protein TNCV_329991 [Trichonephila clavipes]|nr:hypothetical protein TNCV_329991 [Trichonephila clavipes]